jgi:hypothetical protein
MVHKTNACWRLHQIYATIQTVSIAATEERLLLLVEQPCRQAGERQNNFSRPGSSTVRRNSQCGTGVVFSSWVSIVQPVRSRKPASRPSRFLPPFLCPAFPALAHQSRKRLPTRHHHGLGIDTETARPTGLKPPTCGDQDGATKQGEFMTEKEAVQKGYRPANDTGE